MKTAKGHYYIIDILTDLKPNSHSLYIKKTAYIIIRLNIILLILVRIEDYYIYLLLTIYIYKKKKTINIIIKLNILYIIDIR